MNISQRELRFFITTAALKNISRASEILNISQPALTRAIKEMEAQLGAQLFQRTTRQLALTFEGERFLPIAQRLLQDLDQAVNDLREQSSGLQGTVTLAVGTAFGCTLLPDILRGFTQTHPGVRVRIRDDNSAGITQRVIRSEVDLGIGSLIGNDSDLQCQLLLTAPLGLLADSSHFDLSGDLSRLPLLKESDDTSIMHLLRSHGSGLISQMNLGVEVSSLAIQLALTKAGVGVAVLSALGASHPEAAQLQFLPITPTVEREIYVIQRADRRLSPSTRALLKAIQSGTYRTKLHPAVRLAETNAVSNHGA